MPRLLVTAKPQTGSPVKHIVAADHPCVLNTAAPPLSIGNSDVNLKLQLLERNLVPKDLLNTIAQLVELMPTACIYVDNAGTPTRYPLKDLLQLLDRISWDNLDVELQTKLASLTADLADVMEKVKVYSNGTVVSINGQQGIVTLTAADVHALSDTTKLFSGSYSDLIGAPDVNAIVNEKVSQMTTSLVVDGGLITEGGIVND